VTVLDGRRALSVSVQPSRAINQEVAGVRPAAAVVMVVLVACAIEGVTRFGGPGADSFFRDWVVQAIYVGAAATVAMRARRPGPDRTAWALLAGGMACYALGFVAFAAVGGPGATAPVFVHALWLSFYPLAFIALAELLRARMTPFPRTLWVDSLTGALTIGSILMIWVFPPLLERYGGDAAQTVALLAYPVFDATLLTFALIAVTLSGWRPGASWLLLAMAFAVVLLGDSLLLYEGATGPLGHPAAMSTAFPAAVLLMAAASLSVPRPLRRRPEDRIAWLLFPGACVVVALALIVVDQFRALPNDTLLLPLVVIALAGVRAAATIADQRRVYETRRFERGFQDATIGMAIVSATDLTWMQVNGSLAEMVGYAPDELVGRPILDVMHRDDQALTVERRDAAVGDRGRPPAREVRFLRSDGAVLDVAVTTSLVHDDEASEPYFFSQMQDVTARRRAERQKAAIAELGHRALRVSDVRPLMQDAVELVAETLAVHQASLLRLSADGSEFRFEAWASPQTPYDIGIPTGKGSQAGYTLMQDAAVIANDLQAEARFSVPRTPFTIGPARAVSVPVRRRGGPNDVLLVHEAARDRRFDDDDARFLEAVANVLAGALDRADADGELRRRALEDPLTGLANRALMNSQLEHALHATSRHGSQVAVLLLDLDRFKYLNDTLGHSLGDALLREVAMRLRSEVRDEDVVARLGGDEFVIVCMEPAGEAGIAEIAQRIVDVLAEPFSVGARELFATASVGVAVGGAGATAERLLRDADAAMYRAKDGGGARYEVFDAELRARLVQRMSTEAALRQALDRHELCVRYQPVVEPATGRVAGFEALLRWHHPDRGLVSPAEFIPIAEETDLILPIGRWVLRTACAQAAVWNRARPSDPVAMAVNLSPRQVTPELVDDVAGALAHSGLPAGWLMLEITESLLLEQASTIGVVSDLRALGVRVALDDFGSGYSSLSYLQSYPLDVVKLDRGFVDSLDESTASAAVVTAAIDMARALGLRVVAEGVERESQLVRLRELGCPYVQGFLFAPALDPADAAELLGGMRLAAR
jgi:diguanylate cyclase (GGDEF)-like protein/PAS domain S-box-containing protein